MRHIHFTLDHLRAARRADLYSFLLEHHPDSVRIEGRSLRPSSDGSISIKRGFPGYYDFADGSSGNPVDYLCRYLGYNLPDAVLSLCEDPIYTCGAEPESHPGIDLSSKRSGSVLSLPEPLKGRYKQVFAYLTRTRGIPTGTVQSLIRQGILYQEVAHNNAVFINNERDFAELHGTLSYGKSFHSVRKTTPDRFWWMRSAPGAKIAYVCESAIDAISLYLIHGQDGGRIHDAYYISIAGVANQATIDRIARQACLERVILAVDNDSAGQTCRDRNPDLESIVPDGKDWNDDWIELYC